MIKKTATLTILLTLLLPSVISTTKAETSSPSQQSEQDEEVTRFEEWGIETMKEWEKHTPVLSSLHYLVALAPVWMSALELTENRDHDRTKLRMLSSSIIYILSLIYKKWSDEISSKVKIPLKKKRGEFLSRLNKTIASNCFFILFLNFLCIQ